MIRIKRTYEPAARGDGQRFLVERLWPRGIKKEALDLDAWLKDVAPSTELRKWFNHRVDRWTEFKKRYRKELSANPDAWQPIVVASKRGAVTLLYSAHDTDHNGALVLRDYLARRGVGRTAARKTHTRRRARKTIGARKRTPAKRATAKRATAKRTTAKRATAKRATAKRTTAKRATAKRRTAKRATAKRARA